MIAAIYARKSTAQSGPDDKSESVERQLANARVYATRKGWTVADAHVYADAGISGAEFGDRRPGLARLLNAPKPKPPFQVLVMSEESRLGRESIKVAYALKALVQAGVCVFLYLEDRERTIDTPTDKLLLSVAAYADELERERARQRTYDAMERKARALHVTGGKVYGYDNVEVAGADGRRLHVVRRINEGQAAVVRRIFALCTEGMGFTRIAKLLNEDGIASPRHASGWAPTAIRACSGPSTAARLRGTRNRSGTAGASSDTWTGPSPSGSGWTRPTLESCRRTSGAWPIGGWNMARELYAFSGGRPDRPAQEKYLLSGIARCATCGGSLLAFTRDYKQTGKRGRFYGCGYNHKRGKKVPESPAHPPGEVRQGGAGRPRRTPSMSEYSSGPSRRLSSGSGSSPTARRTAAATIKAELPPLEARIRTVVERS